MAPATVYSTSPTPKVALPSNNASQHESDMAPEVVTGNRAATVSAQEKDEDHRDEETRMTPSTTHHGPTPSGKFGCVALSTILARRPDRLRALSTIVPEPRQEGLLESRRLENMISGGVVPERQGPKSDRFDGRAVLNEPTAANVEVIPRSYSVPPTTPPLGPFPHSHAPQVSLPTISANITSAALDSLPELPWLPSVFVGLMIVFSVSGLTFVALTCLVHFPLQKGYFYKLCVKLRLVPQTHEHEDYEDSDSDSAYQPVSEDTASTSGTTYRLSQLSPNSPMPTAPWLSDSSAFLEPTSVACAYDAMDTQQSSTRRRRLPPSPLNLFPARIHATSFPQRSAFPRTSFDEESLTPRSLQRSSVLDILHNLPLMSGVLSTGELGSPVGSEASAALLGGSEGLRRRKTGKRGWGGRRSLVERFEGLVDKMADGLVRYIKDGAGDEGLLLPVTAEERGGWEALEEAVDNNQ